MFGGAVERDVVGAPGAAFDTQNREKRGRSRDYRVKD